MGQEPSLGVLVERIEGIGKDIAEIKVQMGKLGEGQNQIARLEERHAGHDAAIQRAFKWLNDQEARVKTLEVQAPINRMISKWVIAGVVGVVGMVGVEAFALVVNMNKSPHLQVTLDRQVIERLHNEGSNNK